MRFTLIAAAVALAPHPLLAQDDPTPGDAKWAFEESDLELDPRFIVDTLDNGMRTIIVANDRPEGTGQVRLRIGSGSLSETDEERGLAHYLEHMAFNGSARIPEGEMIKLLEREGLAFGADTNASTSFGETIYKLDLPRNDTDLLETALMIMRETASELTIDPDAVDRERGVILAERRDRTNFSLRETLDRFEFTSPDARYVDRLPIGTAEVLESATAADLREFYEREYVPANATLVVVGDFEPGAVRSLIGKYFGDWTPAPTPAEASAGPVDITRQGETDIYIDPALSERVTISRHSAWEEKPDTSATRREQLLISVGYSALNRRLQRIARAEDAPFRSAGFGTGNVFEEARETRLIVDSIDGGWEPALLAAAREWRGAMARGFTPSEIDEQLARIRRSQLNAVESANTRSNGSWTAAALALVDDKRIPTTAQSSLERFEAFAPYITPASVLAALQSDAAPLDNPLIRFRGRTAPDGGKAALRSAWNAAIEADLPPPVEDRAQEWAYSDFGEPGAIVADTVEPLFEIRTLRFANGVRLNLKQTDLQEDRIAFRVHLDGGRLLDTEDNPLATELVGLLPAGGLGAHSQDELVSITAGRSVGLSLGRGGDNFSMSGTTRPEDLLLQMQLLAAAISDPGYRQEAIARYRRNIGNFFETLNSTPVRALGNAAGGIYSDNDPRFTLQDRAAYEVLDFDALRAAIGDRLDSGAIEIGLVGDFDPDAAIAAIASTFGALPDREPEFVSREEARQRRFTENRTPRTLTHSGEANQALLRMTWPTTDDRDQAEVVRLELLERITRLALQEELRERLGQAYSPSARSSPSRTYRDYGTFSINAALDYADLDQGRTAIKAVIERLGADPVDEDTLERARRPLLEAIDNALKSNGSWLALVDRAQSEDFRLIRQKAARGLVEEVTPQDILDTAQRYLALENALVISVIPENAAE